MWRYALPLPLGAPACPTTSLPDILAVTCVPCADAIPGTTIATRRADATITTQRLTRIKTDPFVVVRTLIGISTGTVSTLNRWSTRGTNDRFGWASRRAL